jgi:transposase
MDAATPSRVAGLDWASRLHAVCVLDPDGQVRARFDVPHTGSELRGLTRRLVRLGVGQVAIERPDGPVVEALLAAGLEVVVIPGRQVKALRGRYGTAGNNDDRFGAYVLADALRTDGHRLVPLVPDAPETTALRVVSRARKSLVATRVALANELRANLEIAFPGAATLFSDVDSPIALAFLRRFPSVTQAAWLTEARLAAFLRRMGYPGRKAAAELLGRLADAPAGLTGPEGEARAMVTLGLSRPWTRSGPRSRSLRVRSWSGLAPMPMRPSSPPCPDPAGCAPLRCWPRSATAGPGSPTPSR